jgi:hypothetical protein
MEFLAPLLLKTDDLIRKNASLNQNKIAWWLGMPHTAGASKFYDLFELCNGELTNVPSNYGWIYSTRPSGWASLHLSGNGDYVAISDNSKFQFDTDNFTISGWFYLDTLSNGNANGRQVIISRYESAGSKGYSVGVNTTGSITFEASLSAVTNASFSSGTGLISADTWYHFTAVRSGINFYLYVNGQLEASGTSAALWSLSSTSQNTLIGDKVDASSNHYYFSGKIDDVSIYNVALSSAYAQRIYNESRTGYLTTLMQIRLDDPSRISFPWVYQTLLQNTYGVTL